MYVTDRTEDYITGWMLDAGFRVEHRSDPESKFISSYEGDLVLIDGEGVECETVALSNAADMKRRISEISLYNE